MQCNRVNFSQNHAVRIGFRIVEIRSSLSDAGVLHCDSQTPAAGLRSICLSVKRLKAFVSNPLLLACNNESPVLEFGNEFRSPRVDLPGFAAFQGSAPSRRSGAVATGDPPNASQLDELPHQLGRRGEASFSTPTKANHERGGANRRQLVKRACESPSRTHSRRRASQDRRRADVLRARRKRVLLIYAAIASIVARFTLRLSLSRY